MQPELRSRREAGVDVPVLVWRFAEPLPTIASGPLGGGLGLRRWVVNATVPMSYDRDDPDVHLAGIAAGLGLLEGPGVGLLTGVDVARYVEAADAGVVVTATVGLGAPVWAAAPAAPAAPVGAPAAAPAAPVDDLHGGGDRAPGTINIVAYVPARLSDAALVNAVATIAEAKAQALWELGVPATGTCTDATTLSCRAGGPAEPYGGPRSTWGGRLARAVHSAVLAGGVAWNDTPEPWSATAG